MRSSHKRAAIWAVSITLFSVLVVPGCPDNVGTVTAVQRLVWGESAVHLYRAGDTVTVLVTAFDAEGAEIADAGIVFASSDAAVATVEETGTITAVGVGECVITATVGGTARQLRVTVGAPIVFAGSESIYAWTGPGADLQEAAGTSLSGGVTSSDVHGNFLGLTTYNWLTGVGAFHLVDLAPTGNRTGADGWTQESLAFDFATEANNPSGCFFIDRTQVYVTSLDTVGGAYVLAKIRTEPAPMAVVQTWEMPNPQALSFAPAALCGYQNRLFIANSGWNGMGYDAGTLSVFDWYLGEFVDANPATQGTPDPIALSLLNPQDVLVGPDGLLYVTCTGDYMGTGSGVCVVDPVTLNELASIDLPFTNPGNAVADTSGRLYVVDVWGQAGLTLYSIDLAMRAVVRDSLDPIVIGDHPGDAAFGMHCEPATGRLWLADFNTNTLHTLDTTQDTNSGPLPAGAVTTDTPTIGSWLGWPTWITPASQPVFAAAVVNYPVPAPAYSEPIAALGSPQGAGPMMGSTAVVTVPDGGQLVLGFDGYVVTDGPGDDFIVYENVFLTDIGKPGDVPSGAWRFIDPGTVAVSQDGLEWHTFPQTLSLTVPEEFHARHWLAGFCGVEPVLTNPASTLSPTGWLAGGDRFDLAAVDLDWARYVRITALDQLHTPDIDAIAAIHASQD